MSAYAWAYRCSICGELVEVDDVTKHLNEEKAKPTWSGIIEMMREDKDEHDAH